MSKQNEYSFIYIQELTELFKALESDLLIIQDKDDTKKITLQNLILSIIKDDELPGPARLYSSEKIQKMIDNFTIENDKTISGALEDINILKENSVTKKLLEEIIKELDAKKLEEKDLEGIINTLAGKRDKNVPITSADLDTSDDVFKIKLANLSEEVLNAMAGDAPVTLPAVPPGGWSSRHIANRAIISTKLATTYRYKGFITEDSVNNIIDDGIYLLGPETKDLPKYIPSDINLRLMEVTRYGESGHYIKQEIEYLNNTDIRPRYVRKGVTSNISIIKFHEEWDITNNYKIDSHVLADNYDSKGIIESGNIFDVEASGSYFVMKGVTGTPNTDRAYTLTISRHENTIIYELLETNDDYALMYVSQKFLRSSGIPTITPWHSINKLNKSKFDGKKLLIYGDDISYGIGASKLRYTSYGALMRSEYGFVVENHALADATLGNYNDITCENRSVLTQIGSSTINDTHNYCIIFVGTNDWLKPGTEVGKIDDYCDITFYGAFNKALRMLYTYAPKLKIILVTPTFRARQEYSDNKNSDDYPIGYIYLREYVDAIINIGKKYHIPVVNLYDNMGINKYNNQSYLPDGAHPNDDGHRKIANMIYEHMNLYF